MGMTEVYQPDNQLGKRTEANSQVAAPVQDSRSERVEQQRAAEAAAKAMAPLVELTPERIAELLGIAAMFPGAHRHLARVECALRRGPLNSLEALYLGSLHVPARILALRCAGFEVTSRWVRVRAFDGEIHRVHEWRLLSAPAPAPVEAGN